LFFATDIHGSDTCWHKFINAARFYAADVMILGGDMTGKAVVPIVYQGNATYRVALLEQEALLHGEEEVQQMEKRIRSRGYYPYRTTPDEVQEINADPHRLNRLFVSEALKTIERWLAYADERLIQNGARCYVCPGNDDVFEIDDLIRSSKCVYLAEGEALPIEDCHEMISCGWSNPTPWHTCREEDEEALAARMERMVTLMKNPATGIFNFHVPPHGSLIDDAPVLTQDLRVKYAGNALQPVGSRAVRTAIERMQPLLGLFGHIHESRGTTRIGRTLCINPGSMYEQGTLLGVLVKVEHGKIKNYVLTTG